MVMQEVRHELLKVRKQFKCSGALLRKKRTPYYVLWDDIENVLSYYIKEEER